ncbi:hypothetical protein CONPUDRAFT_168133 [Coniophora puteana RWD-64-598 SS2]|uniref:Uncharacterized protein n=1 Tax=Coniophora puteana (strain RWD-64-598) TaxID=741705 RepID=A0A5M3MD25_CONPW|nr:uncharacterized protein CONPUDRAFT_168133 [Coniophora puteana RWD-64-598 SS2]EIW77118.1 hypothetical protein CONPUDRAFT_168133 [Coniophora puteana RWD-64-598 SS2]
MSPNTADAMTNTPTHRAPYGLRSKSRATQQAKPYNLRSRARSERAAKAQLEAACKGTRPPRSRAAASTHKSQQTANTAISALPREATPCLPEILALPSAGPETPQQQIGVDTTTTAPDAPRKPQWGAGSASIAIANSALFVITEESDLFDSDRFGDSEI